MPKDAPGRSPIFSTPRSRPRHENSDEELIAKIADGNRLAMQVLYARHQTRIFRLLLCLAGDADIAEGLVADVFLSAWRLAPRFDGGTTVSTWLIAIARGKAEGATQRGTVTQSNMEQATIGDPTPARLTASRAVHRGEKLRTCLARLPREQREMIDLVYYHGKSLPEIAGITGLSQTGVRAQMLQARRRLAELLERAPHHVQHSVPM
jgi:RNA polymerase sigma-70 factor, ECF subfamily